jgi:hypothetical protein
MGAMATAIEKLHNDLELWKGLIFNSNTKTILYSWDDVEEN